MAEAPNHHQEGSFPGREASQGHQGHHGLPQTVIQPHGGRFGVGVGGRRAGAATEGMLLPGLETAVRPNSAGGPSPALPVSPSSSGYISR